MKRNAMSAPFMKALDQHRELSSRPPLNDGSPEPQGPMMQLHYRDQEALYIQAGVDKVTIVYSTKFVEETDRVFGKVFLQVREEAQVSTVPEC